MPIYETLIMGRDRSLSHQVNEGDIISIRPYPFNWGAKEIAMGVVVLFEHEAIGHDELEQLYVDTIHEGGKTGREVDTEQQAATDARGAWIDAYIEANASQEIKDIVAYSKENQDPLPSSAWIVLDSYLSENVYPAADKAGKTIPLRPTLLQKRTYRIKISELEKKASSYDRIKQQDKTKIYQPFKQASQVVEKFDGKDGNCLVTEDQVDTGEEAETETILTRIEFEAAIEQKTLKDITDKIVLVK